MTNATSRTCVRAGRGPETDCANQPLRDATLHGPAVSVLTARGVASGTCVSWPLDAPRPCRCASILKLRGGRHGDSTCGYCCLLELLQHSRAGPNLLQLRHQKLTGGGLPENAGVSKG